jgi:hypothetical protein
MEKIITGILEFLKSNEFAALMASLLASWEIVRGVVGKFATAKVKMKEKSYLRALTIKDESIDKIVTDLTLQNERLKEMYLASLEEVKATRNDIANIIEAQKVAFNNSNLNASSKHLISQILDRSVKSEKEGEGKEPKLADFLLDNPKEEKQQEPINSPETIRWVN